MEKCATQEKVGTFISSTEADCNKASCIFLVLARPRQIVSQETTGCTYYVPFNLEFSNLSGGMLKIPKYSFVCCLWLKYVLTPTVAVFTS